MIFDAHCDIWTDVTHHHLAGKEISSADIITNG